MEDNRLLVDRLYTRQKTVAALSENKIAGFTHLTFSLNRWAYDLTESFAVKWSAQFHQCLKLLCACRRQKASVSLGRSLFICLHGCFEIIISKHK